MSATEVLETRVQPTKEEIAKGVPEKGMERINYVVTSTSKTHRLRHVKPKKNQKLRNQTVLKYLIE